MRSLVVLCLLLAGCADPIEPAPAAEFGGRQLDVDDESGVILGVVVDETIFPVAGAAVRVNQSGQTVFVASTDADGRFAADGLAPGFYVLHASAPGFFGIEAKAVVVAGLPEPDIVKIVLARDTSQTRFHLQHVWEGRVACASTGGNWCAIPHIYTGMDPMDDDSVRLFEHEFLGPRRMPDWVQVELVWSSTQAATPQLNQRLTATNSEMWALGSWNYTYDWIGGESPVVYAIDGKTIRESRLGQEMGLSIETFAPEPGVTVDQSFTEFITVFYGYTPPEGWRFVDRSTVPPPP